MSNVQKKVGNDFRNDSLLTLSMTLPCGHLCSTSSSMTASSRWRQQSAAARSWGRHSTGTVLLTGTRTTAPPSRTLTRPAPSLMSRPANMS